MVWGIPFRAIIWKQLRYNCERKFIGGLGVVSFISAQVEFNVDLIEVVFTLVVICEAMIVTDAIKEYKIFFTIQLKIE